MKLGPKLKEERLKMKLTQENIAEILNVSRQTISSWETGRSYPDLESLVALSDLYNISLDNLLREDTSMVKKISNDTKIASSLIKRGKYIALILILIIISVGSIIYINSNKHLHVNVSASESNTYNIQVKGSKKYYNIGKSNLDMNNRYTKTIELNNFNNTVSIYNKSKNKIFDIKILDSKNNKVIDQIDSVYPNTLWEVDLNSGDYNILIRSNEYNRKE